ncbi:hypothetical protein RBWH47_01697 [Rhodopirellula baltica WH47]|uniref:Uncharacterized protein n=1 Tax=Rhodopirellula baltica WH47 TaxID=991778 RepID=F2AV44_RHOBT|nr:hypothetical protein RBWH47_01697 [Rhodopirellula baltica WH47]
MHGESNSQTGNHLDQLPLIERFGGVVGAIAVQHFS